MWPVLLLRHYSRRFSTLWHSDKPWSLSAASKPSVTMVTILGRQAVCRLYSGSISKRSEMDYWVAVTYLPWSGKLLSLLIFIFYTVFLSGFVCTYYIVLIYVIAVQLDIFKKKWNLLCFFYKKWLLYYISISVVYYNTQYCERTLVFCMVFLVY